MYEVDRDLGNPAERDLSDVRAPIPGFVAGARRVSGWATVDGADLGPSLARVGGEVGIMVRRFGLSIDAAPHLETAPFDALTLGSANVHAAFVLLPRWQLHATFGASFMIDGRRTASGERVDGGGIVTGVRTTVLPVHPLVLRGRLEGGILGAAPTWLARGTAGVMVARAELFAGYEARRVGSVVLRGPTLGLRVWF
ncbi:MAG: hypothetical protein AAF721_18350 [Myxococcota bacterium]